MASDARLSVCRWDEFQHYKDRRPPWIKVYRTLLDNPEWRNLDDFAGRLLIEIWLLASEMDDGGTVQDDSKWLAWRLRYASNQAGRIEQALETLQHQGFITRASSVLAGCKQDAIPETETETKKEKEERKRFCPPTVQEVSETVTEKGYTLDPEAFVAHYASVGWMVGKTKMKDWKAALVTWHKNHAKWNPVKPAGTGYGKTWV